MGSRGAKYYRERTDDIEKKYRQEFHLITDEDSIDPESERTSYELFRKLKETNFSTRKSTDKHQLYSLEDHQQQIYDLSNKYKKQLDIKNQKYEFELRSANTNAYGYQYDAYDENLNPSIRLVLRNKLIYDTEDYVSNEKKDISINWHTKVDDNKVHLYTTTHEFGHVLESSIIHKHIKRENKKITSDEIQKLKTDLATRIKNQVINICKQKYKDDNIYVSDYAEKDDDPFEFFAETFTNLELSSQPKKIAIALNDFLQGEDYDNL